MKPYHLSTLVLLLLLVDISLSIPNPTRFVSPRDFLKRIRKKAVLKSLEFSKEILEYSLDKFPPPPPHIPSTVPKMESLAPSPSPESPQRKIKGLGLLKQYFYEFGYYPNTGSGNFTDYLDDNVKLSFKNYMEYFNLSSKPLHATAEHILMQRCGVPDVNYDFGFYNNSNLSWPKGRFPGRKKNLTYGFEPESQIPQNITNVFRRAFQRWSQSIAGLNLSLTEATSPDEAADIIVGFYQVNRTFEDLVVADAVMQLNATGHNNNVVVGKVRLDIIESWTLPGEEGVDLETVAMHQIGHILGLDHSNDEKAVMYPSILPSRPRKVKLALDDVQKMQQLYATASGDAGDAGRVVTFPFAMLVHCLAFMILVF